jgi:hypothetical protein
VRQGAYGVGLLGRPGNRGREWYTTGGVDASLGSAGLGWARLAAVGFAVVVALAGGAAGRALPRGRGRRRCHALPYRFIKEHPGGYRDVQALNRP